MTHLPYRLAKADHIEEVVDAIVEIILSDSNVEEVETPTEGPPVSGETWLAVKAQLLALLSDSHEYSHEGNCA